ncbi:uncharacterized protein [Epargyreus clarus]|uniref:uncharacterized protein n=1 Tax=Epargyreus clarus TaxID=520877 RepID=UPI003C2CA399
MSYLSTSENVGFSGIPQTIPDASCATQYKMAVEGVSGGCGGEVNMFIHDSSGDEQTYIPHLSDNFFHTKFKIDPSELYTFNDSDVIANEITVSHTEDNFIFPETLEKSKLCQSPSKELDILSGISNGDIHDGIKKVVVTNGHYSPDRKINIINHKEIKTNAKVQKAKSQGQKEISRTNGTEARRRSIHSPKAQNVTANSNSQTGKVSINSASTNSVKAATVTKSLSGSETFLDVFKREQGVVETQMPVASIEKIPTPIIKVPTQAPKKVPTPKPSQSKPRRGRGPTVHEALQRIPNQRRVIAVPNSAWHAPGEEIFRCGPLNDKQANSFRQLDSSSDDDPIPDFESASGPVCVEESAAESRGARLALRRAALRRHVARAATTLDLGSDLKEYKSLASLIKKQINSPGSSANLPPQTLNHLLAMRGMSSVLTIQERRMLRSSGWSGGESGRSIDTPATCAEERCTESPVPCARYCLSHITLAPEQRLYAACAAVFAGGERCKQPLLPLHEQTPLCAEHAWKRDNYEQMSRECKPQKAARKRVWTPSARVTKPQRSPRRPKRRRRLVPRRPPTQSQSLSEINVCSNSSTYDSSEDTAVGGLSENEYIAPGNSHELEVGQVPPDDILDPSVLSQIPDEAFTEFFNQAEGGPAFAETSELTAALEAVLDERALDTIADCVFTPPHAAPAPAAPAKVQVPAAVTLEMSSSAPS